MEVSTPPLCSIFRTDAQNGNEDPQKGPWTPETRAQKNSNLTNWVPGGRVELSTPPLCSIFRTDAENGNESL